MPDSWVGSQLSHLLCAIAAQLFWTARRCDMHCWGQANEGNPCRVYEMASGLHLLDEPVPIECWHYAGHLQPCIPAVAGMAGWHRDIVLQETDTAGLLATFSCGQNLVLPAQVPSQQQQLTTAAS